MGKKLVLVVDDQPEVLKFVKIDLQLRGFEVITTTSGEEALDLVNSIKPDIMLLDVIMPEIDGFQILKKLRTFTDLPIIVFSASEGNRNNAFKLGADDFLPKPLNTDDMFRRIKKLVPD